MGTQIHSVSLATSAATSRPRRSGALVSGGACQRGFSQRGSQQSVGLGLQCLSRDVRAAVLPSSLRPPLLLNPQNKIQKNEGFLCCRVGLWDLLDVISTALCLLSVRHYRSWPVNLKEGDWWINRRLEGEGHVSFQTPPAWLRPYLLLLHEERACPRHAPVSENDEALSDSRETTPRAECVMS